MNGKFVYHNKLANKGILRMGDPISEDSTLIINHHSTRIEYFSAGCTQTFWIIESLLNEWHTLFKAGNHSVIEHFNLQYQVQLFLNGQNVLLSPLTAIGALRVLTDFTLPKARRFYLSMGNPLAVKRLGKPSRWTFIRKIEMETLHTHISTQI